MGVCISIETRTNEKNFKKCEVSSVTSLGQII
jgi:hypothetical protein